MMVDASTFQSQCTCVLNLTVYSCDLIYENLFRAIQVLGSSCGLESKTLAWCEYKCCPASMFFQPACKLKY